MIKDFKENIITYDDFNAVLKNDSYYDGRWDYFNEIIDYLKTLDDIHSVLEFGPYKLPFVKGSDIIDMHDIYKDEYPFEVGNFIVHDCTQLPLPIEDNKYDLVIACQVIEHLGTSGEQIELFKELERISKKAVISLPFLWHRPVNRGHHMIDRKMIFRWTGGQKPTYELISGKNKTLRILQVYEFDKEKDIDKKYMQEKIHQDQEIVYKQTPIYKKNLKTFNRLTEKNNKLKDKNQKLIEKNKKLMKEIRKLESKNEKLTENKNQLDDELNKMKNTTSWKITKPLRDIKSKF